MNKYIQQKQQQTNNRLYQTLMTLDPGLVALGKNMAL